MAELLKGKPVVDSMALDLRARIEALGRAKVVPALSGQRTLKEAVDEALAAWIANPDTFYVLGSAVGPHPYPTMVRHFQAVIGCEAREQMLAECGKLPVAAFACVGGGSNAIGLFAGFVDDADVRLIGVEPAGANCMQESLRQGQVTTLSEVNTIADGTAVKRPGEKLFPYIQENVDDIITIDDSELIVAFLDMVENHKMIVENSGLLTVAALKHMDVQKKKIVSILSGGNMDVITMSSIVQHGLIQRDRVFTVSVLLPDKPGELARVSALLAKEQGNIIKLEHNQFISINRNAAVELRITLEAFGTEHKNQIVAALTGAGYRPKLVKFKGTYSEM